MEIDINDKNELADKLEFLKIDLIVIGPEIPLANGLADFLRKKIIKYLALAKMEQNLNIANHGQRNLCKMQTFQLQTFGKYSLEEAKKIIHSSTIPLVVKADGLASGKGVFIPESKEECFSAAESIFNGKFGNSGDVVVLEEKIQGPEVSVLRSATERDTHYFLQHKIINVSMREIKVLIQEGWELILLPHL